MGRVDIGIVPTRYTEAPMGYAKSTGTEDRLYAEVRILSRSFEKHSDLRTVLKNPVLLVQKRLSLVYTVIVGDALVGHELACSTMLVLESRRESFSQYIYLSFLDLYRKDRRVDTIKLTTAVPVNHEVWERIRNSASHLLRAEMELQTGVDPFIEGGFILDINDFRLDASIAAQLKRVGQQFTDKNRGVIQQ